METSIFQTGIANLDYLLCGGVRWIGRRPPSILIQGPAGAGKSVLSTTLAVRTFRRGKSIAYFSLEQKAADIEDLCRRFPWWDEKIVPYIQLEKTPPPPVPSPIDKPIFGIFQYTSILHEAQIDDPIRAGTAFLKYIRGSLKLFASRNLGLIVVDSLPDAVREQQTNSGGLLSFYQRRSLFLALCGCGESPEFKAPVVIALETIQESDWREYVADVVIQLGTERSSSRENTSRFLQIRKARNQPIIQGTHPIRILKDKGITIYPNVSEVLFLLGSQPEVPDGSVRFSGLMGMDQFIGQTRPQSPDIGHILAGSTTLLYGQDQTMKNGVAASFLLEGLKAPHHACMYLVAGQSASVTQVMVKSYFERFGFSEFATFSDRLFFLRIDRYGTSLSETLDYLSAAISGASDGKRIARVVVNDLAAINDDNLVLMLKELFISKGVTALFVHSVFGDEDSRHRELFDNVIRTKRVYARDRLSKRITYRLNKIQGTSIPPALWELTRNPETKQFVIQDTLRDYLEGNDGVLHSPPLELVLWCPFDDLEDDCKTIFKVIFGAGDVDKSLDSDAPSLTLFYRFEAELILESVRSLPQNQLLPKTRVLCFDDPWGQALLNDNNLEVFEKKQFSDILATIHPTALEGCYSKTNHNQLLALPHHLDLGIYLLHTEVLKKLEIDARSAFDRTFYWDELAEILPKVNNSGRLVEFSSNGMDESFLCFILEVMRPFLELTKNDLGLSSQKAIDALNSLRKILGELYTQSPPGDSYPWSNPLANIRGSSKSKPRDDRPPKSQITALFQRHWYVSYRRLIRKHSNLARNYVLIQPPVLRTQNSSQQAKALRGDWFLGVIKGSPSPMRGAWAMRVLTGNTANFYMHSHGLGLPIHRPFFPDQLDASKLQKLYSETWSRRDIKNYQFVRTPLLESLTEVFREDKGPEDVANLLRDFGRKICERDSSFTPQ